ncbi:MAG: DEAD/DEAH box helicase [Acidobacteria bacterium]|nr:MAG: DEAD/DEAH box helicase [Acidobacteriota bacterium]
MASATFASLELSPSLVAAVSALGYEEPTPIQREAIPVLLSGRDLVGQAGTGTGKTAAFALPLLNRLLAEKPHAKAGKDAARFPPVRALVLVPTRELAMQVAEAIHKYSKGTQLTVVPCYGGAPMDQQIRALMRGASVVVATPGRAIDHLKRKTLDLSQLSMLVLDEADEMLDMGFAEDLETIIGATPETRQTALFAATMAPRIAAIANQHLRQPARVTIAREKRAAGKLPQIRQVAYIVARAQKIEAFGRVLEFENPKSAIVFCRTRVEVDELTDTLKSHGYSAQAIHGGMEQRQRDKVMGLFRAGKCDMLIATDVAARGLDIEHVSHVINYDPPNAPEVYVHRIGRTGRAGREGVAITFADHRERRFLRNIENLTKQPIEMLPLPTASDLKARRLETTRAALKERIEAGGLDEEKKFIQSLTHDFDVAEIAAAAIALAFASEPDVPEIEIPEPPPSRPYKSQPYQSRGDRPERGSKPYKGARPKTGGAEGSHEGVDLSDIAVLRIGVGKKAGVGPGDLVGAIAGEAGIPSRLIGAIRVAHDHSLVQVPAQLFDQIAGALKKATIRGKRVDVSRDPS